jgi:hypothetical protein
MHIHALSLPWHIKVPLDTPTTTHQLSILLFLISIPKSPKKHHLLCLLVSSSHNAPSSEPHFSPANQSGRLSPPQLTSPGGSSPSRVTSFHTWPTPYQATASLWSTPSRRSTWTTPSWLCDPMHPRPHLKRPFACARTLPWHCVLLVLTPSLVTFSSNRRLPTPFSPFVPFGSATA